MRKSNSDQTAFVLGFMALSFIISIVRIMVVIYFTNALFDKEVIAFTLDNIFYGWCIYSILKFDLKFELRAS